MPTIQHKLEVPYQASEMYQLVDRVEDYAQFLPWCKESHVISRDEDEVRATLTLAAGAFQKSFTTCNRLQKDKMIEIRLIDGPFDTLEGFWRFDPLESKGCSISLDLEFEFSSKLIALAFGPVFHQVASSLVDAFRKRADQVYGVVE
jgi:ribosome-associated toxin RatA of RatAB toxin-antitoxin module